MTDKVQTHDIELPPLPPLRITPDVEPIDYPEVAKVLMDYARAAVEADRKRRGEPVGYVSPSAIKRLKTGGNAIVGELRPGFFDVPLYTAPQPAHPAITHCDNCGCDWLDNGLNPVGCPYCKNSDTVQQSAEGESESNYPIKYYKQGGVTYAVHGTSSINYVERLLTEIADLTTALETAREDAWQPIETAPRDGTTVVVYFKGHGAMTVTWEDPYGDDPKAAVWCVTDHKHGPYPVRGYLTGDDTHWRPLPAPPATNSYHKGD